MINILVIEDQKLLRDSLKNSINNETDMKVIAESDDSSLAELLCKKHNPDLILMDICTANNSNGIEATAQIKKNNPDIKIIIMTGIPEITFLNEAKKAGADSFIYKDISITDLVSSIRNTFSNYSIFPEKETKNLLSDANLTQKELEILKLVCEAKSRKEISSELHLSESSVKSYITNILSKTNFDSISRLAIYAVSNNFIFPNKNHSLT